MPCRSGKSAWPFCRHKALPLRQVDGSSQEHMMLYLIGGAPRCGKTTVARQLAKTRCCSRVPADYLGTAFTNYIPATELQERYPAWQTATVDERYERYSSAEI